MATEVETSAPADSLPTRLSRHVDLLQRIEEILREERADLIQAAKNLENAAPLTVEQADLAQLRDEFRQEVERMQRNAGMHESLASVRKLKSEMTERNRAIDAPNGNGDQADRVASRWRNFIPGSGNGQ